MNTEKFERLLGFHLWALVIKESIEILRNKYLIFLLLVPPVIQLLILGAALDPQVRNLTMGIADNALNANSRGLISLIAADHIFTSSVICRNSDDLGKKVEDGTVDIGVVIPPHFAENAEQRRPSAVQVFIDGANAYSAGIAYGYLSRIFEHFHPGEHATAPVTPIDPEITVLYNPGLLSSWFFLPGVLGATLTLSATLVASASILRERESGTMEQLLMTPAETWELILAKVIPLAVFLIGDVCLAVIATRLVFGLPFRGSVTLFFTASILYVFVGIGLGMLLGTICRSQRQAQLASFFINIPLIQLSGTVVPFDTMPQVLKDLAMVDPLKYYADIARSVILKGTGWQMHYYDIAILFLFAVLVLSVSIVRFRRKLA